MSKVSGKAFDFKLLRRLMRYIIPYKGSFLAAFILTIILSGLTTVRPMLIQYTIDNFILIPNAEGLLKYTLIMIGLLVLESVFQFLFIYVANWIGQSILIDLRTRLYKHILSFKLNYFDRTPIGTLITRVVSDIETLADVFSQGLLVIFGDLLKLIVVVIAMFWIDWRLALVSLATIPILVVATRWFQRSIKATFQSVRNEVSTLNSFVQEHVTGMSIVQIFNREDKVFDDFKAINHRHKIANVKTIWYFSIFLPIVEILSAISLGLVVWFGGWQAAVGSDISLGTIMAFILFIHMLFRPIRQLADKFNTLQLGMVSSERVFKIIDTDDHIADTGKHESEQLQGAVSFKNVWFAYNNEDYVLKDVSFEVKPGETVAIVGATGAGKSSIINLVNRFYDINKGEICIDGKDIKDFSLESLRQNIAFVLQDVFLFSDSILNNITLGREVSEEDVIKAAKSIEVDSFVKNLPGGYHYNVRERGAMLSAGQRQLLSFLRAYVTNPGILILDEATSSVDTYTEQLIQTAIEKLTENRTSIIIAHRLATIQHADKILVMDKGEIVEAGTHNELLGSNGIYKNLYEMQFIDEEA
ncbi:MAG: ATP-binding cassette subfamily B multidrug efflux pump [Flavobacteriales bacterium]|jgi:ATP-binding cassette subfamily B multidrug efflux pump